MLLRRTTSSTAMAAATMATQAAVAAERSFYVRAIGRRRRTSVVGSSPGAIAVSSSRIRIVALATPSSSSSSKTKGKASPPRRLIAAPTTTTTTTTTANSFVDLPPLNSQTVDEDAPEAVVIVGKRWWDYSSWTPRGRGLLLLNILVLLCASNWVIVKQATDADAPANFTALRFLVAALAFAPFLPLAAKSTVSAGLELGFWSAAGYATQAVGLMTTDASRASFLSAFTVVAVPLLSGTRVAGEPKRVEPVTWLCAASAILGVFLLENAAVDPGPGDAWALASAFLFAVQILRTEARSKALGDDDKQVLPLLAVTVATVAGISAAAAATLACFPIDSAGGAGAGAGGASSGGGVGPAIDAALSWLSHPKESLAALLPKAPELLWTGLLSTDAVLLIELVALRDVTSIDAAIIYTLEPVIGGCLAWALLGERFGPLGFVGAAIILSSALAAQLLGGGGGGEGEGEGSKEKRNKDKSSSIGSSSGSKKKR